MGVWDNIARRLGYQPIDYYALQSGAGAKALPITDAPAFLRAEALGEQYNIPERSLPESQLDSYRRLSWVQIAVDAVASFAVTTPFSVKRLAGDKVEDVPNHPFELLLRRPNPLQSRAEFFENTVKNYDVTGNAYWWMNQVNGSAPTELWTLAPHKMTPVPDGRMFLRGWLYEAEPGKPIPLDVSEVVHFKRFHPTNPFVGLSPIEALSMTVAGDLAMQRYNTNYFDKDNAKIPGMLAFADPIPDPDWNRMKAEIKAEYGGTQRRLMLTRNAGRGGVQWISTAMSQADMEFLNSRTFNKEEIFSIYAPGLASMLAVNATEANSISGKRTFAELAVWPLLVRMAEKITNDVLPLFGPDLVGEFDDIRVTDRELELAEIAAFGQTHTVDEVREKFYQSAPLGDARGSLLVSEAGSGAGMAPAADDGTDAADSAGATKSILGYHIDAGVVTRNEARADVGLPPVDDSTDELLRDLNAKIAVIAAAKNAGLAIEPIARMIGMGNIEVAPEPVSPFAQGAPDDTAAPDDAGSDDPAAADTADTGSDDDADPALRQAEAKALRRWLRKRGDKADPLKFRRVHLSESDVLALAGEMGAPVMPLDPETVTTLAGWTAYKAMVLAHDPGDDGTPEERALLALEDAAQRDIAKALREVYRGLLPPDAETMELHELQAYIAQRLENQAVNDAIDAAVRRAADVGINIAADQLGTLGVGFDYTMIHTRAREWARGYSAQLITNINATTRQAVQESVSRWYTNGERLDALVADLSGTFDARRARLIAMTETTHSAAQGTLRGYEASGVVKAMIWMTANDEKVCPWCGSLDGQTVALEGSFSDKLPADLQAKLRGRTFKAPPAHPGCRCRIGAEIIEVRNG